MVFKNPFDTPFKIISIARTNQSLTLNWESQNNRTFDIEASSNLVVVDAVRHESFDHDHQFAISFSRRTTSPTK